MLTRIDIHNYRSIRDASVPLAPFTLLIGANGTGKSNFLRLLKDFSGVSHIGLRPGHPLSSSKHYACSVENQLVSFHNDRGEHYTVRDSPDVLANTAIADGSPLSELRDVRVFSLDPTKAGASEPLTANPTIQEDGAGIVQVLDALKTGDREDLFNRIEKTFKQQIPSVEKLSFVPGQTQKSLQVRERFLPNTVPMNALSEGSRLALMITAILYQEDKPSLICVEDIDRGLHPRLFQQVVELCFDLSERDDGVQIIATTHNPYLVDQFEDRESAVLIVEKENGQTTFTTLADKLGANEAEEPLGSLWYSGFVGGVPQDT